MKTLTRYHSSRAIPTVVIPCRWEPIEGEPCEADVLVNLDEGHIDFATFSCGHEALIMADPKLAADMEAEAAGAYTDKMEQLYDAHVDACIDRAHDKAMGF